MTSLPLAKREHGYARAVFSFDASTEEVVPPLARLSSCFVIIIVAGKQLEQRCFCRGGRAGTTECAVPNARQVHSAVLVVRSVWAHTLFQHWRWCP